MEEAVLFSVENQTGIITLNRPERRNAMNQALITGLYNALEEVTGNDTIRCAIITGNGPSFCSGIDLSVLGKENIFDPRGDGKDLPDFFMNCTKPIIGAVNGHAITGGFEIALNCDFLIASEEASFADTHAKVGIHPGWGMTQLLQQAVGQRMAKQLSCTGQFLSARDALRCGLVNEVVPPVDLIPRAMEICRQICETKEALLPVIMRLINKRNSGTLKESYDYERKEFRKFVARHMG